MNQSRGVKGWIVGAIDLTGVWFLTRDLYWQKSELEHAYVHPEDFFDSSYDTAKTLRRTTVFGIPAIYDPSNDVSFIYGSSIYTEMYRKIKEEKR